MIPSEVLAWTLVPLMDLFMSTEKAPSITSEHPLVFDIGVELTLIL
jgi:hypothetical protein